MRTLVALLGAAVLATAAGSAQASGPGISLSVSAFKVLYGHHITLTGRISPQATGRSVVIVARRYGASSPVRIATVTTHAGGRFAFTAKPSVGTTYFAKWNTVRSRTLTIGVQPAIAAIEAGDGRIWTQVSPISRFAEQSVKLQQLVNGTWQTIASKRLGAFSMTYFATSIPTSTVRIALSVNQAGRGFLGSTSHALRYKAYDLTLVPSAFKVTYGNSVKLAGRLRNGRLGEPITIEAWPYGASSPVKLATVTTGINGAWRVTATPKIRTMYQARLGNVEASPRMTVGVAPAITVRELRNGNVAAHVVLGHSLKGRLVKLQLLTSGAFRMVEQAPIGLDSTAIFKASLPTGKIRAALSVNEAGPGYLGGTSGTLAYHGHSLAMRVSALAVDYGETLTLSGRIVNGRAGQTITVWAWPYAKSSPHRVATVTSGAGGRWSALVTPRIQTAYSAHWGAIQSRRMTVGVRPALTLKELTDGNIWTHVQAARSFAGRQVKLQQRMSGGSWRTVMQMKLNRDSSIVFPLVLKPSTIRVAMSVNQAGKGYLGATSNLFRYSAT